MTDQFTKTISWKINNKLLTRFQKAKTNEAFSSAPINIGSYLFFLHVCPGGTSFNDDVGYVQFNIRAVQLGYNINNIKISYKSRINSLFVRQEGTYTFKNNQNKWLCFYYYKVNITRTIKCS